MTDQDKDTAAKVKAQSKEPSHESPSVAADKPLIDKNVSPAAAAPAASAKRRSQSSKKKTAIVAETKVGGGEAKIKSVAVHPGQPPTYTAAGWLAVLALLLAGGAAAGSYWLWQQGESDLAVRQQQLDTLQAEISTVQQQLISAAQVQELKWQGFQQQQGQQLEALRQQLSQSRDPQWLLAEAEYLIRLANHRLQLAADVDTALTALSLADQRLEILHDPALLPLRRQLTADLVRLRAVARIDVTGMALTLSTLQQQLQQLPLQGRLTSTETMASVANEPSSEGVAAASGGLQFLTDIWASLLSLVTIRHVDDQSVAVVAVTQRGFLYQNLALKLEAARLALLRQDDVLYHQSLATVQGWLKRYFDRQDSAVQSLVTSLQQLDAIKLDRELPVATASLVAIQRLRSNKARVDQSTPNKPSVLTDEKKTSSDKDVIAGEDKRTGEQP